MAVRHSDRHLDPHGHSHGPRRDELHGCHVATARPQQNKGTRHLPTGALLAIRSSIYVISPTRHKAPSIKLTFLMWKTLHKFSTTAFVLYAHCCPRWNRDQLNMNQITQERGGQSPVSLSHGAIAHHRPLTALSSLSSPHRRYGGPRSDIQEDWAELFSRGIWNHVIMSKCHHVIMPLRISHSPKPTSAQSKPSQHDPSQFMQ